MKNFSVVSAVLAATLPSALETFAQSEPYKVFDTRPVITPDGKVVHTVTIPSRPAGSRE